MALICSFACLWVIAVSRGRKETSFVFDFVPGGLFLSFLLSFCFFLFWGFLMNRGGVFGGFELTCVKTTG